MRFAAVALVFSSLLAWGGTPCRGQRLADLQSGDVHNTAEWADVAMHLPNPSTSSAEKLETAADVLRARRFQADAVVYYAAAMQRGGEPGTLLKKMGIACLEMQQITLARMYFERAVHLHKRDAVAWNDLGAADFTLHDLPSAIGDYKHSLKVERNSAVVHSNLALAYFEANNPDQGRRELAKALELDPDLLHRSSQGGYNARVLASTRYSEVCFEMARIFALQGNAEATLDWLAKASERGFDVRSAMDRDPALRPWLIDARVQVILKNSKQLHGGAVAAAKVPSLGEPGR